MPLGQHPCRFRVSRSPGRLRTSRGHRRINSWEHYQPPRNWGHLPVDGTGGDLSRKVRFHWRAQKTASIEEHGYLRAWYDDPRGKHVQFPLLYIEILNGSLGRLLLDVPRSAASPQRLLYLKLLKGTDRVGHLRGSRISCGSC